VRKDLRLAATAPTRAACRQALERIAAELRQAGHEAAAETVLRDVEDLLTFYDFPQEHWQHLRTTNPIESIFAGVRLRTHIAKRLPNVNNAVCLVYKIVQRLAQHGRKITGSSLCGLVVAGVTFEDGQMAQPLAASGRRAGGYALAISIAFGVPRQAQVSWPVRVRSGQGPGRPVATIRRQG